MCGPRLVGKTMEAQERNAGSRRNFKPGMARLPDGRLQTLPLITHHFPAREAPRAWDLINTRREPVLGVILDW